MSRSGREPVIADWAWRASVVLALVPIVVAVVRALLGHWYLASDDGVLTLRAFDVFSHHPPLLGSWSSGSGWSGINFNNPGPLQFWLLAIPVRILGPTVGAVVGAAATNAAAVVVAAWLARRRAGAWFAVAAMAGVLALEWAMGSLLLFDVWQPHAAVLPCFVLLLATWSLACGDLPALPIALFTASLLAQMHLSYLLVAPGLVIVGLVLLAWWVRDGDGVAEGAAEEGAADPAGAGPAGRRRGRARRARLRRTARWLAWSAVGAVVLWLPTIIQQLTGHPGNLTALARASAATGGPPVAGTSTALRTVASVVALPPWWFPPGWSRPTFETVRLGQFLPFAYGLPAAVFAIAAVVVLVLVAGRSAWRRRERAGWSAAVVALVAVALAAASASQARSGFHSIESYVRWLWPISLFVWLFLGWQACLASAAWWRTREARRRHTASGWGVALLLVPCVAFAAVACTHADHGSGSPEWTWAPSRAVVDQAVPALARRGPILVHEHLDLGAYATEPSLMLALAQRAVPFFTDDVAMSHQIGSNRLLGRHRTATTVWLVSGDAALFTPAGAQRLALRRGLSPAHEDEMRALQAQVSAWVGRHGIPLTARGRKLIGQSWMAATKSVVSSARSHPEAAIGGLTLDVLLRDGMVDAPASVLASLTRLRDLSLAWSEGTIALFATPTGSPLDRSLRGGPANPVSASATTAGAGSPVPLPSH